MSGDQDDTTSNLVNGEVKGHNGVGVDDEEEMNLEMFRACADPGRKKSLRSLEIPLDNLLSGIIYTAGGRDKRGGPVLVLTQPASLELDALIEITDQEFFDMLAYFSSVPSEESRQLGFSVVIDGEVIHDFLLRVMIKALAIMHSEDTLFHKVYFVSSVRDITSIDWKKEYCNRSDLPDLPFQQIKSQAALYEVVDKSQLTSEFGGTLSYNHHDWVRFRMQVEPFLCDCISISKRLARAVEPFTENPAPNSIEQAEESLHKHRLIRRKTLEVLHIDDLASEGSRIDEHMQATASPQLSSNPDFTSTLATISNLLGEIGHVKERVEALWTARHDKLQASIKQKTFEKEASKVIEWFEEYAEEFFQTHTDLGESLEIAEALVEEVKHFEESTRQIVHSTGELLTSGAELELTPYTDQQTVQPLMGKIKQLVNDFDSRLSKRKKKLDDSVRLHRLTAAALDWCIESSSVLSGSEMLNNSNRAGIDTDQVKHELEQFLSKYPPPSDQDMQTVQELTETIENQWIKDNALFAYTRVMEVKERFKYYHKLLDELIEERQQQTKEPGLEAIKRDSVVTRVSLGGEEDEPDAVLLESKPIEDPAPQQVVKLRPKQKPVSNSLLYDDTGVGHAMMLLKSVAQSAEEHLQPAVEGTDSPKSGSRCSSPHHISKQDISNPTRTHGPLFKTGTTFDSDEEDNLQAMTVTEQRAKITELPCPVEDSLKNQTKHARHRRKLMEELIQTEETYIRDMQWVVDHYMPAMDDISSIPRNLVGKKNLIFSTIPQLLQFNKLVILPQLKILGKCPVKLGQFFMTLEEDLLNYSVYFKNLPQQTLLMEEGGIKFFEMVSHNINDRFFLNSYLIKPFQRITKYKIFLEEMSKHSTRSELKGKLKEYYDKLKEAQKMVDFILRHGNDLLAVECLRGYEGNMREHGKVLRQGDLILVEFHKHHRRMFLFENTIILAKKRKPKHQVHEVASSERFDFKQEFKTSDYGLRENVDGHPTRFQLYKKKECLTFQAETEVEKNVWVQDIWDLFFSHMLNLKDQNLEAHGSHALTSIAASGSATIGRSFGHTLRRAVSIRHSSASRYSRDVRGGNSRPSSLTQNRHSASVLSEESTTHRHSGTFVDLRPNSSFDTETVSDRSSIISASSISTLGSSVPTPSGLLGSEKPYYLSPVPRPEGGAESPEVSSPHYYTDSSSSSSSSLRAAGGKSPLPVRGKSPQPSPTGAGLVPPPAAGPRADGTSSTSSLDSVEETLHYYDTPV